MIGEDSERLKHVDAPRLQGQGAGQEQAGEGKTGSDMC